MGSISKNDGSNKREEVVGKKPQTPVEKVVTETKDKVHNAQKGQ